MIVILSGPASFWAAVGYNKCSYFLRSFLSFAHSSHRAFGLNDFELRIRQLLFVVSDVMSSPSVFGRFVSPRDGFRVFDRCTAYTSTSRSSPHGPVFHRICVAPTCKVQFSASIYARVTTGVRQWFFHVIELFQLFGVHFRDDLLEWSVRKPSVPVTLARVSHVDLAGTTDLIRTRTDVRVRQSQERKSTKV